MFDISIFGGMEWKRRARKRTNSTLTRNVQYALKKLLQENTGPKFKLEKMTILYSFYLSKKTTPDGRFDLFTSRRHGVHSAKAILNFPPKNLKSSAFSFPVPL